MSETHRQDREIIRRYTDQPSRLPLDLRRRIESAWGGEPVQLYALADLDAAMRLTQAWLVLGPSRVAWASRAEGGGWSVRHIERDRIRAVRDAPGLSGSVLTLLAEPDEPALARVRFTHRQRRAMENLKFVLEEGTEAGATPRDVADPTDGALRADEEYARGVAAPIRDAQALVAGNRMAVIWRLLGYLKPYRRQVTVGFAAAAVITLVSLVPPWLAGYLIDEIVRPVQEGTLSRSEGALVAWLAVGAMAVVYIVRQAGAVLRLRLMSILGEWVARDLRTELFEHLQRLSLSFYTRKKTGGLITRVSSDTDRLWDFLAFGVVDVSLSLVMLVGLSAVLLSLDWKLGLVMTLPVPAFCWAIYRHGESLNRVFVRAWRKWSRVTDVLSDTIPGMRVVKAFAQEDREKGRFDERNYAVTEEYNRIHHIWTTFWPTLMLAVHATTVAVWAFAIPRLLDTGEPSLSAGTFVSFLLYTTMFVAPIEVIGQMARTMNRATSSAHRVFEVLDTEPEIIDVEDAVRLEPVRGRVTFEDVTFGYDGVQLVLKGVSFEVEPGEMIGLVGPSGGGKSTIVSLIARFYEPTGGRILIDGVNLRRLDTVHYRRQVGMVLQDPYL
ncbi:MAG: ABC transporter transmembrane domain-containing protein, partial [Gemmatimonadota bacterium]|nr:ABC transporter transmembrane domain-containing protein [Gemmatimonadota bacterium]